MYNIVELFSGIGSQLKALQNLGSEPEVVATCEWDVHAIIAYDLIHNDAVIPDDIARMNKESLLEELNKFTFSNSGKEALDYTSLKTYSVDVLRHLLNAIRRNRNYVDINAMDGGNLPDNIDILTYSFPCQDLSNVGAFHGYNLGIDRDSGSRSSLLWQVGRILSELQNGNKRLPRFLLMENVPTLLSERHFPNFSAWIEQLKGLGYVSKYYPLNAADFGLPQNRPRLLMISVFVGDNKGEIELIHEYFGNTTAEKVIEDYRHSDFFRQWTIKDLLRTDYTKQSAFEEAIECTPNDTVSRRKIWEDNPQIILQGNIFNEKINMIRTITTKQDRNPNSGNLYFDCGISGRSKFRYLTPRECLLFMGFTDRDYINLATNNLEFHKGDALFTRDKIIRLAGNSIPVKLLEGIFLQIMKIDALLKDYRQCSFAVSGGHSVKKVHAKQITKFMFAHGIRCRKPGGQYPESPDVIFPRYKVALFIYDCVQHGHNCDNSSIPEKNRDFWRNRIKDIAERDHAAHKELAVQGWHVLIVWKCELNKDNFGATMKRLETRIRECISSVSESAV